ncbi:MAG: hypothetical protein AAGK09_06725 [Planctomycetota bacterium]
MNNQRHRIIALTLVLVAVATAVTPIDSAASAQVIRSPLDPPTESSTAPTTPAAPAAAVQERWFEPAYGLSFEPPEGAIEMQNTRSGSLVTFALPPDFRISVHLYDVGEPITLRDAARQTAEQFVSTSPSAVQLKPSDNPIKPAGRPSLHLGFAVPAEAGRPAWVAELVLMKLDPTHFVVFQADLNAASFGPHTKAVFNRLLRSVDVAALDAIDRARVQLVETADQWAAEIDFDDLWDRLPDRAWFRLIRDGEEVGVRRMAFGRGTQMGAPGYTLEILSYEIQSDTEINTKAEFFLSERRDEELWSIQTESQMLDAGSLPLVDVVPRKGEAPVPMPINATTHVMKQTGLRSGGEVTVIRDSAEHADQTTWPVPPVGYLSRIETELLAMLLVDERPVRMQAYAYHGNAEDHAIALRTETATQLDNGSWSVNTRATPTSGWRSYLFDDRGRLLQINLADGGALVPATLEQVRQLWADQLDGLGAR